MGFVSVLKARIDNLDNYEWFFNMHMYDIRVSVETIEKYFGGRSWSWINGYNADGFKRALDGANNFDPNCKTESKQAIKEAWYNDDLYGRILSGDPSVLASLWEVDVDAIGWFKTVLQSVIQWSRPSALVWREMMGRKNGWSGYRDYSVPWTED